MNIDKYLKKIYKSYENRCEFGEIFHKISINVQININTLVWLIFH